MNVFYINYVFLKISKTLCMQVAFIALGEFGGSAFGKGWVFQYRFLNTMVFGVRGEPNTIYIVYKIYKISRRPIPPFI